MVWHKKGLIFLVKSRSKAKKSRFSNIKVPGAVFEIEFGGRGELKNLYTSEIIDSVVIDESNLKIHLYLHEIIIRTLELEAPVKPIFESLLTILKEIEKINDSSQKEIKLRQFEFQLISDGGPGHFQKLCNTIQHAKWLNDRYCDGSCGIL